MIRLVVISNSPPTTTRYFNQPSIIIGRADSPFADLPLPEDFLQENHVQIILDHKGYQAINVANDPFATVNGKPFGKKKLNPNDIIQVGNAVIRFEYKEEFIEKESIKEEFIKEESIKEEPIEKESIKEESFKEEPLKEETIKEEPLSTLVDTKELLPIILEKKLTEFAEAAQETPDIPFSFDLTLEEEEEFLAAQQSDMLYEDYINLQENIVFAPPDFLHIDVIQTPDSAPPEQESPSVELSTPPHSTEKTEQSPHPLADSLATATINSLNSVKESPVVPSAIPTTSSVSTPKLSLKDYYLSEYDDVGENSSSSTNEPSLPKIISSAHHWMIYLKVFGIITLLTILTLAGAYLWMLHQSDQEETTVSKSVADIAMALTHAQIKNIHPQNQNWSDPEFIRNNLVAVLPSKYSGHTDFDLHGQFTSCPYFLRIYTSGDLSQFLVIAQPGPSILQWLIPKSTIIVDSRAMEMRKTTDLKSLNRLLVNANTQEGMSSGEVSHLVSQGTLIPLSSLKDKLEDNGFSAPKTLSTMHPGAENLIYNAPRYFLLSEELIKRALDLIEKSTSNHDVIRLQQELTALKKLPDAIFYISGGIQNAVHAQRALATISPNETFLLGYVQLNDNGCIANCHLLMDGSSQEAAISEKSLSKHDNNQLFNEVLPHSSSPDPLKTDEASVQRTLADEDNPLFLQFSALNVFRQQALRPLCEEMINTINLETHSPQKDFESKFKQLLAKYTETDNEQQVKIQKKMDGIYRENTHVSAAQFFHLAQAAGLKQSLADYIAHLKGSQNAPEFTQEKLEKSLNAIEKATNWQSFEQEVIELVELLNLDRIPNEDQLIAFQNAARSRIIQKLNQFILAPEQPQILQAFDPEYRYTLIHILKMGWITDPDTYDFYLDEFDHRTMPRGSVSNEENEEEEEGEE